MELIEDLVEELLVGVTSYKSPKGCGSNLSKHAW